MSPDYIFRGSASPDVGLSPALIGRYQAGLLNKVDDSMQEGYISLTTVRRVQLGCCFQSVDYSVISKAYRMGKISGNRHALTVSIGNPGLSEDFNLVFFMPENLMQLWYRGLKGLVDAVHVLNRRQPDRQIQWLKKQYLNLFFEGNRCQGSTPAEAVKV